MNVYFMHYEVFRGIDCGMHLVTDNNFNEWASNANIYQLYEKSNALWLILLG